MTSIHRLIALSFLTACFTFANAAANDQATIGFDGTCAKPGADIANCAVADKPTFTFGGFGSLGASHSDQSLGDYVLDGTVPKGAGRSNKWSVGNDSRIGLQVSADFTPKMSVVLQVVSEYQADGTYQPVVEWANVKYAFAPNAYIRAGRIALPTFLYSDSREVGYSFPWIHPPVDVYRQLSMTNSDGIDFSYRWEIAEMTNSIKIICGVGESVRPTSTSTVRDLWGIFDTLEYGPVTLRVGYQERTSSSHNHLTGVTGAWIPNSDLSVGASYDSGDWFAISEWIQRKSTSKLQAMYVSGGRRIEKFTPYVTYSQNSPASFLLGFPAPTASSIQNARRYESTVSLGVRWDFMRHADFKLQIDQVHLGDDSNGYLANVPAGVILYGTSFHVTSAVLDFTF